MNKGTPIILGIILAIFASFQPVLAIDEVVDDYEDETKVAGKHQIVRNTTFKAMELEWGSTLTLDSPMDIWTTGGFTEVDPGEDNLQNINGTSIWFNQVDRDEGDRIYKDFGANYFDGSWEYHFRVKISDFQVSNACAYFMGFSETTTDFYTAINNDDDLVAFHIFWPAATSRWELSLRSVDEGVVTEDTETEDQELDLDKWYHVTYIRDGDTVTAQFYNDALKTSLDFMLTVVDEGVSDLRYFHPLNAENQATGGRSMAMWLNWVRNRTVIVEGYLPDGHFYTTDILDGINYTAQAVLLNSTIPNDDSLTVEFSKDNSTWVEHNNVTGSDTVIAGYEAIDLRDLNYTTLYFRFNFTGGAIITSTPRLYQLRLVHSAPGEEVIMDSSGIILFCIAIIMPIVAFMVKKR